MSATTSAGTIWRERRIQWGVPSAVAVTAGLTMLFLCQRVTLPGGTAAELKAAAAQDGVTAAPALAITRTKWLPVDSEARDRLSLLDPTPLFMPGKWKVELEAAVPQLDDRPGGEVASTFPPALMFTEARPARDLFLPNVVDTPQRAASLVASNRWFRGLARKDRESGSDDGSGKSGRVDVYLVGGAQPLRTFTYEQGEIVSEAPWRPVELQVLVDAAGEVVAPMVKTSSGEEIVDQKVSELTRNEWLPRLLLRPGNYRFVVGP